jgi:aromatic-L-amino-acid/L-tryptophan decarboxylase
MTPDEFTRAGYRAVDLIAGYLRELPDRPVFTPVPPAEVAAFAGQPGPEHGSPVEQVLDEFRRTIAPYPFGNGHPRFFGWVNSPPHPLGIIAEALAAARHRAAARVGVDLRTVGLSGTPQRFALYVGQDGHGCAHKAADLLGLGSANVRLIDSDADHRIRPDELDRHLAADRAAGIIPIAVVASVGTVNTGAIDPIDDVATICQRYGAWLHLDAAYGGPAALLLDEYAGTRDGIARADSLALDPHKWLYAPVDAGLVLIRDAAAARDCFSLVPPYLRTEGDQGGVTGPVWFSE